MTQNNWYQRILPKSDLLKKYIAGFYVYNNYKLENEKVTYYAFPQSGTDISFCNATEISISDNEASIGKNLTKKPIVIFLGKYLTPLKINYKNYVQKITIHFTETGVVNFFPNYYSTYGKDNIQTMPLSKLNLDIKALFSEDIEKGLEYLESYLLSIYSSNSLPLIERTVELFKADLSISIIELAEQLGMNKKTFSRQFKKHVGCTTSEFKRITKFKKTARNYFNGKHENLAQLCYDNGYYDASYFYKQFYRTTSFSPKYFFKNVKKIGPENGIYIFE